jgi:hypothetical protein
MPLADVETHTKSYKAARDKLAGRVAALTAEVEAVKRRKLPGIKAAVAEAGEARSALEASIDANRNCFTRPKTLVIAGIRVGLAKGKGRLVYDDEQTVVERIRRQLPDAADNLVKVTEKPIRKALEQLSSADLKRLGCTIEDTGDQIVIKPTDADVDKIVNALLAEAEKAEAA